MTTRTFAEALAETLALVPEHTTDPAYIVSLFADGHKAELENARRAGYAQAEADMAASWRQATRTVLAIADPNGPEARESAARRLRAAEAGCRRDAAAWERGYVRRAHNTPDHLRTPEQRATVRLCPRRADAA